ncbi:C-type lectin domain family 17, member A-like isoform X3 [Pelecanus crispus]|uniref:C-type lectin domain family 17, member A-like isoform X3 n=1 Tax=Pelecanus crispus TaxID=36300 RepID=UPI003F5D2318
MYGNIESGQAGQGQMWVLEPGGRKACSDLCPTEENLYEPLDPPIATPSQKQGPDPPGTAWARARASSAGQNHTAVKAGATRLCPNRGPVVTHPPSPASGCCSREKLVLVGTVALGVSVLLNVLFLAAGLQHIAALTAALEAEKAKELPNMASQSFLLYNEDHRKCVEARGQQLTVTACQPKAAAQQFQWLPGGRLQGWGSQHCITAARGQNLAFVRLEPCRDDDMLQRWECRDGCPPCSKGWTYFRNSCYFYSKTETSWENAQRFCSVLGTQLLEVDSPEEKDHIRTILESSSWLGIRDEEVEGSWKRANGSIQTRESSSWHRNEPNGGLQENCAVVREDGEWYDYPCESQLPWVCEGHP